MLGLTLVVSFCAFLVFMPCGISLILASWIALLTRPWMLKLAKRLRGRTKAAALMTSAVVIAFLGPVVVALVPVVGSALNLASEVGQSQQWNDAANSVLGDGENDEDLVKVLREQLTSGSRLLAMALQTSATILFGIAIFVVSLFAFSTSGEGILAWLRNHAPLKRAHFDRLGAAYAETGRGLIVGVGVTAVIQGIIATITFAAVGIPRALALGLLTTVGSLLPGIGTALVWGPVTAILALGGYPWKAAIVGFSGAVIIGSVDNFLKPIISTHVSLKLPAIMVFITMLSGVVAFGPAGLLLGPLFVRIAMEALEIVRDERWTGESDDATTSAKLVKRAS